MEGKTGWAEHLGITVPSRVNDLTCEPVKQYVSQCQIFFQ